MNWVQQDFLRLLEQHRRAGEHHNRDLVALRPDEGCEGEVVVEVGVCLEGATRGDWD